MFATSEHHTCACPKTRYRLCSIWGFNGKANENRRINVGAILIAGKNILKKLIIRNKTYLSGDYILPGVFITFMLQLLLLKKCYVIISLKNKNGEKTNDK